MGIVDRVAAAVAAVEQSAFDKTKLAAVKQAMRDADEHDDIPAVVAALCQRTGELLAESYPEYAGSFRSDPDDIPPKPGAVAAFRSIVAVANGEPTTEHLDGLSPDETHQALNYAINAYTQGLHHRGQPETGTT